MKQRFSSLDVKVTAHELSQALIGLRLANIYDISSKKLLFKFAVSGKKEQLIIESGFCTHLTDFTRTTAAAPSAFTARLRKYLKTRRCTSVTQIGTDRIIELKFSDGAYHVYLEFFASGNVIVTDPEYKILAILRNVSESEGQEVQKLGSIYSLENRQGYKGVPPLTRERVRTALETSVKKAEATEASTKKKQKRKPGDELRRALATTVEELPPTVLDHAFAVTGFESLSMPADILANETLFESLFVALEEARKVIDEVTSAATCKGHIIAKKRQVPDETLPEAPQETDKPQNLLYEDFQPFLPKKFADSPEYIILTFDNFNKTVDEYFSSLEGQKLEGRLNDREEAAKRKLEAVKQIQGQKVEGLKQAQMLNMRKAGAIEANVDRVSEAMDAVNGLVKQGMDWVTIGKLIEREQKRRNPVAEIIKLPLNLAEDTITLLLGEEEEEPEVKDDDEGYHTSSAENSSEEEDEDKGKATDNRLAIEINLGLTPFANAREYYDQKKVAAGKAAKTEEQSVTALKNAEKKIAMDLKKGLKGEKPMLQLTRHQMWFEKFLWFISSDGYLVVGGKDAGTNEILYKRHLRKGDTYVHADMHGAASVIIKNNPNTPDAPIPPTTLTQAGSLSVCSSSAWDSKAGMGAWWVHADQVSKSAPTGDILPVGSFMIRGNKNLLAPQPLVLGFGFMFKISEETKGHHVKHRLQEADDARTEAYITGKPADKAVAGNIEDDLAALAVEDSTDSPEQPEDAKDQAEKQDENDGSGDDQDSGENAERQNPLQIITDVADSDNDSGNEAQQSDDEDFDADNDHVKDGAEDQATGDSADAMMSGAIGTHPDGDDYFPGDNEETTPAAADNSDHGANEDSGADDDSDTDTPAAAAQRGTTTASQQQKPTPGPAPAKRGRRAKQKKIATKYAHQDPEDRALHEQLLGATKGREKAAAEAAALAARKADEDARRERRRVALERQKARLAEHEAERARKLAEGEPDDDDADGQAEEDQTPLDALVGTPFVGDDILSAIPVCAPWAALAKCKYKVKLQPGNTKKGKAIKEVLERWKIAGAERRNVDETARDRERMWPREVELMRAVKPEEAHNVVPVGKMTVVLSGGKAGGGGGGGGNGGKGKGGARGRGSKKK